MAPTPSESRHSTRTDGTALPETVTTAYTSSNTYEGKQMPATDADQLEMKRQDRHFQRQTIREQQKLHAQQAKRLRGR